MTSGTEEFNSVNFSEVDWVYLGLLQRNLSNLRGFILGEFY